MRKFVFHRKGHDSRISLILFKRCRNHFRPSVKPDFFRRAWPAVGVGVRRIPNEKVRLRWTECNPIVIIYFHNEKIVAPMEMRVAEIAKAHQVEKTEARKIIADADRERIAFIRRFYHQDPENPVHYDLTLNLGELSLATAQAIVLTALHKDFADAC